MNQGRSKVDKKKEHKYQMSKFQNLKQKTPEPLQKDDISHGLHFYEEKEGITFIFSKISKTNATGIFELFESKSTNRFMALKYCQIDLNCMYIIAYNLKNINMLKILNLRDNGLADDAILRLSNGLKFNASLTDINLGKNLIADKGAICISEALQFNTSINILYLGKNIIGNAGAAALVESIRVNSTLQILNLEHNKISDMGAILMAQCYWLSISLRVLMLGNNKISIEGKKCFAQGQIKSDQLLSCDRISGLELKFA